MRNVKKARLAPSIRIAHIHTHTKKKVKHKNKNAIACCLKTKKTEQK